MKNKENIGIYTITFKESIKIYVGSTVNSFNKRRNQHLYCLRLNNHPNKHLQNAFNKYGESSFNFEILEVCPEEYIVSQEQFWINMLNSANPKIGYNLMPNAVGKSGFRYSEESKNKMMISHKI